MEHRSALQSGCAPSPCICMVVMWCASSLFPKLVFFLLYPILIPTVVGIIVNNHVQERFQEIIYSV